MSSPSIQDSAHNANPPVIDQRENRHRAAEIGPGSRGKQVEDEKFESKAPDGGVRAWLALFSSWCMLFSTFGYINSRFAALFVFKGTNSLPGIGTFQGYYEEVLLSAYSASTVAWIPSLVIFFAYLTVSHVMRPYFCRF